jgi:phosphoglycolate phosphatase
MIENALIFDLDGTLTDPAEGIGNSLNYALSAFGYAPIALTDVSQFIGPPLDQSFRQLTGATSAAIINGLVVKYRERYADAGYAENRLYPGIPESLAALAAQGRQLGVCTSKRADFAERILEMFGLQERFAFLSGGDVGVHKVDQLGELLRSGTVGAASTMIGDRSVDVLAAKQHGLRSVGVLWGHGSRDELERAGPNLLLGTVSELHALGR